jgi:hypothetical protein
MRERHSLKYPGLSRRHQTGERSARWCPGRPSKEPKSGRPGPLTSAGPRDHAIKRGTHPTTLHPVGAGKLPPSWRRFRRTDLATLRQLGGGSGGTDRVTCPKAAEGKPRPTWARFHGRHAETAKVAASETGTKLDPVSEAERERAGVKAPSSNLDEASCALSGRGRSTGL